ncbi:EH domain-containing protein 3-like [Acyrthosiphon pisum]|uniref:EF-hand domain-containing protein n=1 Tax=Acyrthosiphon pisum TaxID=7029 RepID=A0A8R2NQ72_ACYPI|nr:EH domain-containing protein 3-like [Acyrthosiphon pisum]|eukprot:XP_016663251.1 PREDICTED: EH domain-containing protein 3-like [Acyrthosiphon pisum]
MSELKSRLPLLSRIINKTHHQNELAAKEEFLQSKLQDSILSKIWKLADQYGDGFLDSDEFALAIYYLIKIKLEGSEFPDTLPKHLLPLSKTNNSLKIILKDLGP